MPKRKLGDTDGPARSSDKAHRKMSMKAVRLGVKFEHGVQMIVRGLKTARGFERQKLSRREKTARSENSENTRMTLLKLAEEIEALKALDYQKTAERYLFKQLSKTKRIAELPTFKEFEESKNITLEGPKSTAEANILARLFKSNPVKNLMPNMIAEIRKLLGVDEAPAGKSGMKEAPQKEKSKKIQAGSESDSKDEVPLKKADKKKKPTKDAEQDSQLEDISGSEGEGFDSDELEQFKSRLAPGSDAEDESDSEDADESGGLGPDDISDSVESRSSSPDFSDAGSPPPKKAKGAKASTAPVKETTFLPSLMMGGYWSGSEEASEDEAAGPPKRKNRMGQQARRALWEKKYGAGANHVKNEEQKQQNNRDNGWDMKRGATGGGRGGYGGRQQNRYDDRSGCRPGFGGQSSRPPKPKEDEGPLHPSWEAKKKQKEQAPAVFAGKKVTFD
ncbi:hypothetical protein N7533_005450 [Penicillium manginii]|uniref:uncharacterized protein n=1 Tax=Penicillium manginii TaxID=203109 RepID=UPI0025480A89|nr:uncharacterized protein N7533_005450 [Penicillium manginii]KAJ5755907.1 hypothetical protein N7533_005450 [Penicillium manginii]